METKSYCGSIIDNTSNPDSTKGKPVIVLHPDNHVYPLKEIDAAAMAVAETPGLVAEILKYVVQKQDKIDS